MMRRDGQGGYQFPRRKSQHDSVHPKSTLNCNCPLHHLLGDQIELIAHPSVGANTVAEHAASGIDPNPQRRRPAAQRMNDRAQRCQSAAHRLPAVGGDNQPDRQAIEIDARIAAGFLNIINRIFDKPRNGAMIARAGNDQAIGPPHQGDQRFASVIKSGRIGAIMRQGHHPMRPKQLGLGTGICRGS